MNGSSLPTLVHTARPLVQAITNFVTMEWVARGLLAAGARPIMARDITEAAAVAGVADSLVLNLGTWSPAVHQAMLDAGATARRRQIPVVLDPVGVGGLATRTEAALELLERVAVAAIRGNAGEILALAGEVGYVRGVDAAVADRGAMALERAAKRVARRFRCVVAVTGERDLVTDGLRTVEVRSGHALMAQIPGAGCLATAIIAAALAASRAGEGRLETVAQALLWAGLAGEEAAQTAGGPGSFAPAYLDRLAGLAALPAGRITPPLSERLALYVIVSGSTPLPVVEAVLGAGVKAIQFREKSLPFRRQTEVARQFLEACRRVGALFLVNDRVDLALTIGADGVHLGQDDMPIATARHLLGPDLILGATCETEEEVRIAEREGASYIGTGPVYLTGSKADAGEPYGPDVVRRVSRATRLPVVGIGGIGPGGAAPVIAAGGAGVACISSVVGAADPGMAAWQILQEVETVKGADLA